MPAIQGFEASVRPGQHEIESSHVSNQVSEIMGLLRLVGAFYPRQLSDKVSLPGFPAVI
jgi:hypothetical protein